MADMVRAREPAEKWSQPTTAGVDPREAFADEASVSAALDAARAVDGHPGARRTRRTPAFLRWRYGFEPLHYRVWPLGSSIADGFAVFRLRRRGAATEAALCELVAPDRGQARRLVRAVAKAAGADYVIAAGRPPGMVPLPGQGPILTWREVGQATRPPLKDWDLALGDIELF